jgi:hypothetical protein
MAFSFGNLSGRGGFFGNCPILSMWFGNQKFYPAGSGDYINLPGTGGTIGYAANYATISNITASTNNWTVESSDTSWLTVTKTSNTQVRYNVTENGITERTGYLYFKIGDTTYATYQVRQMAAELYITVSPTFVNLQNGLATGGTIAVTSNTTAWTVSTVSAGFTAEKYLIGSTYVVRWQVTENTTGAQRIGYINVSYQDVTATTQINQSDSIYVFSGLTTNPMTIGSGQTTFSISLVSRFGQAITEQPSVSIGYNPAMNVQLTSTASGGTQGQWNFVFSCNANDTESQRTTTIVFTQPGSQNTLTYVVHQQRMAPAPSIDGITVKAYSGNWVLGTVTNGQTTVPVGTVDVDGIVIATTSPITEAHTATVSMVYQNGPLTQQGTPTTYTKTNEQISIPAGSTVTAGGNTYYGVWVQTPLPRLSVNQVTQFTVS